MTKANGSHGSQGTRLRSQLWFDNPDNPGMTALYLEAMSITGSRAPSSHPASR